MAIHTVKMGETLTSIARDHYGDSSQWNKIFNANRTHMGNPDNVIPGDQLTIPK
jgi:nucleoid-associated protein YgaU